MQNVQSMYRPVQWVRFRTSSFNRHHHHHHHHHLTHSYCIPCRSPRGSTAQYIQSHLPSQTRHNQQHKQPQTANTQKRLYKHACIRVAPLQPNESPLSRHLLQSNSAAALLCSAHQRCFDYSHAPLAAAGLGSLPHKLVW